VVDPLEERRKQAEADFSCRSYTSLRQMLKQADVEVAVIATPSASHGRDTKAALKAGKHVVVEKPMAASLSEADSMIRAAEQAGLKLFVHQNYRFKREFTHLKDVIDSGILGRVFHIRCYSATFRRRNDWQTLSKNAGGHLNNHGVHMLDQILQLLGAPVKEVFGDLQQIASAGDVEDHAKVVLRAANGTTADMEVSMVENIAAEMPQWIICGSCGTLTRMGKNSTIRWYDPKEAPPLVAVDGPVMSRSYSNDDRLPWQEKVVPAEGPDVGDFYDSVYAVLRNGAEMRVTPESVREVMRVVGLARRGTAFPGRPPRAAKPQPAAHVA
jgi:scyllo-inositol 2-dehydrogenase (NADP+)